MSYLDGIDESERIAKEFWDGERRKRERREEIAAMPRPTERVEAMLKDNWTCEGFESQLYSGSMLWSQTLRPQPLDEWLAEDNPHRLTHYGVPGVLEALGLS